MKPSEMRSIMHAYSAVHSTDVKEELDSSRDQISEMRLTQLTDSDLVEVAEEILEGLFAGGFSVANTQSLLEAVLCESDIPGRQQKVERLQEAFSTVISKVKEKSARTAIESDELDSAQEFVQSAVSALDRAAKKGAIHKSNASRRKSRIMTQMAAAKKDK